MSIKTSSAANPKPSTLIKVNTRGQSDYVLIGGYRIKRTRTGWHLQIAVGENWSRARRYPKRQAAIDAMVAHMRTGKLPTGLTPSLEQRVTALEQRLDMLELATVPAPEATAPSVEP